MLLLIKRCWGWLWGVHICEKFTQWEYKRYNVTRPANQNEYVWGAVREVEYTKKFMERRCTLCGKIQQQELKF